MHMKVMHTNCLFALLSNSNSQEGHQQSIWLQPATNVVLASRQNRIQELVSVMKEEGNIRSITRYDSQNHAYSRRCTR